MRWFIQHRVKGRKLRWLDFTTPRTYHTDEEELKERLRVLHERYPEYEFRPVPPIPPTMMTPSDI
jgi:hypothetical protein